MTVRDTTNEITELEQVEAAVEDDIVEAFAVLGRLLATPPINELAAKRREHAIADTRQEIARMQKVLIDVQLELRMARNMRADG